MATLNWYEYDALQAHIASLSSRSAVAAKWSSFVNTLRDTAVLNKVLPQKFDRLSSLSAALQSRLASWAIVPTCAYNPTTKRLDLKLMFSTRNAMQDTYVYRDDLQLLGHLNLQLEPAYAIITEYLEAPEVGARTMCLLDLPVPKYIQEMPHMGIFLNRYEWDSEKSKWKRKGMPFAVSVLLTYAPFEL